MAIDVNSYLSEIVILMPQSISVLKKYGLDYCCGGKRSLADACVGKKLDPPLVLSEIQSLKAASVANERWDQKSATELIAHILERFHKKHVDDLSVLIPLAKKVESVHASSSDVPQGLHAFLKEFAGELVSHMEKEEGILFPWIERNPAQPPLGPVNVMMHEHESHSHRLAELSGFCRGFNPPEGACTSWRALYSGLRGLAADLEEHIHLENNVLFRLAVGESPLRDRARSGL